MSLVFKKVLLVLIVSGFSGAASADEMSDDELRAHFLAQSKRMTAAFNNEDAEGVAAVYTKDAIFMPMGGSRIVGREGIAAHNKAGWEGFEQVLKIESHGMTRHGDVAHDIGLWTVTIIPDGGEPLSDLGDYFVVWKKQPSGEWLIHVDIFNSNNPPAGQ